MLARVTVSLPFALTVPDGQEFILRAYEDDGCEVVVYPPSKTDVPLRGPAPESIKLDGTPAFQANGLEIQFRKASFERSRGGPCEPSEDQILRAVRSFLNRLRQVTQGPQVRMMSPQEVMWRVRYLNDDETEVEKQDGKVQGAGKLSFTWSLVAVNKAIWEHIHSLDPDFELAPWETLRLDAFAALPHVPSAIVLGATSLEVFIAATLDKMSSRHPLPTGLWNWINDRPDHQREPRVDEQFDALLKSLCGHSLKEESALWQLFSNLKTARNKFVHEGTPLLAKKAVTLEQAIELLNGVTAIMTWVEQWLPEDERRPKFAANASFEVEQSLLRPASDDSSAAQQGVAADELVARPKGAPSGARS